MDAKQTVVGGFPTRPRSTPLNMAEALESAEDTSDSPVVPSSSETFEEARITSSTVFVTGDSGSEVIAGQRKITYQTGTQFYQQTSEFFLSYPRAEPMGGLVGRFAKLLGGNFREEPQDMLQMECVDVPVEDGNQPSRSSSGSCRLSLETQKVSVRIPTHAHMHTCVFTVLSVSLHRLSHSDAA